MAEEIELACQTVETAIKTAVERLETVSAAQTSRSHAEEDLWAARLMVGQVMAIIGLGMARAYGPPGRSTFNAAMQRIVDSWQSKSPATANAVEQLRVEVDQAIGLMLKGGVALAANDPLAQ